MNKLHKVEDIQWLSQGSFLLKIDRKDVLFEPGQHLCLGPEASLHQREYSIYSGINHPSLDVLVRKVPHGFVSKKLASLKKGDYIQVEGPFGQFGLYEPKQSTRHIMIATGTGISPFHSMVASYKNLDYLIIHGVRSSDELYEHDNYEPDRIIPCVSRDETIRGYARVSDWFQENQTDTLAHYYLCGNCDMIYDMYAKLRQAGVDDTRIHTEVYF